MVSVETLDLLVEIADRCEGNLGVARAKAIGIFVDVGVERVAHVLEGTSAVGVGGEEGVDVFDVGECHVLVFLWLVGELTTRHLGGVLGVVSDGELLGVGEGEGARADKTKAVIEYVPIAAGGSEVAAPLHNGSDLKAIKDNSVEGSSPAVASVSPSVLRSRSGELGDGDVSGGGHVLVSFWLVGVAAATRSIEGSEHNSEHRSNIKPGNRPPRATFLNL